MIVIAGLLSIGCFLIFFIMWLNQQLQKNKDVKQQQINKNRHEAFMKKIKGE